MRTIGHERERQGRCHRVVVQFDILIVAPRGKIPRSRSEWQHNSRSVNSNEVRDLSLTASLPATKRRWKSIIRVVRSLSWLYQTAGLKKSLCSLRTPLLNADIGFLHAIRCFTFRTFNQTCVLLSRAPIAIAAIFLVCAPACSLLVFVGETKAVYTYPNWARLRSTRNFLTRASCRLANEFKRDFFSEGGEYDLWIALAPRWSSGGRNEEMCLLRGRHSRWSHQMQILRLQFARVAMER